MLSANVRIWEYGDGLTSMIDGNALENFREQTERMFEKQGGR